MRLSNIAHLYLVRLKARVVLVQEVFAVLGIAIGIALLFASQIAGTSLSGSVAQLTRGVIGQSKYQLNARSSQGFSEKLFREAQHLPGVRAAIPVLDRQASVTGPTGTRAVDLIATDPHFVRFGGPLFHLSATQLAHQEALALPAPISRAVGAGPLESIKLDIDGRSTTTLVGIELTARNIGNLVDSPVAVAPLAYAQKLTGLKGRITRVFVQTYPGDDRQVREGLVRLAAGRVNVEPANFDATLFKQASGPTTQATLLFSAICALVGFMFAFNAMLLTAHLRRGLVRELRRGGSTRWETVKTLMFDALILGSVASLLGLALGDLLSILAFRTAPGYLTFAFPVGSQRIVALQSVVIAAAAGMLAAYVGVLTPLREIWERGSRDPSPKRDTRGSHSIGRLAAGFSCLGVTTTVLLTGVQSVVAAVLGVIALIAALLLLLPLLIDIIVGLIYKLQASTGGASSTLAVLELRAPEARPRTIAIAATGAIAVFGSVAIQGAQTNLQRGLDRLVNQLSTVGDVWVLPSGEQDLLATTPMLGTPRATLAHLPGVRAVGEYRASFLDYGDRRIWVLAPPSTATSPLPSSQIVTGDLRLATERLRSGGWAVISRTLADEHGLRLGQSFILPSPRPTVLKVAALSTNLGWPPGAIILGGADYTHAWDKPPASAYNVMVSPGASLGTVRAEIRRAVGPRTALNVLTARQREQTQQAAGRQGLDRLTQISLLVLFAGILATSTSMGAMIWQRRRRFARMKIQGYETTVLWRALVYESAILLGAGCSIGAAFGVCSQILQSYALANTTGFPVVISAQLLVALLSFVLVTAVAVAVLALPGYRAARIRAYPYA